MVHTGDLGVMHRMHVLMHPMHVNSKMHDMAEGYQKHLCVPLNMQSLNIFTACTLSHTKFNA